MLLLVNQTRGVFSGGYNDSSLFNNIDFVTIATTGNSLDFGDLTALEQMVEQQRALFHKRFSAGGGYHQLEQIYRII